jgi:hypothetical protein
MAKSKLGDRVCFYPLETEESKPFDDKESHETGDGKLGIAFFGTHLFFSMENLLRQFLAKCP